MKVKTKMARELQVKDLKPGDTFKEDYTNSVMILTHCKVPAAEQTPEEINKHLLLAIKLSDGARLFYTPTCKVKKVHGSFVEE